MGSAEKSISVASYRYRDVVGLISGRIDVLAASESLAIQPTTKDDGPDIETQAKRRLTDHHQDRRRREARSSGGTTSCAESSLCMNENHKDFGFYACVGGCLIAAMIEFSMLFAAII
jgi:hypothetical protein